MGIQLNSLFEEMEQSRVDLLVRLSQLTPEQLSFHPAGGWSILQVLDHLQETEESSLRHMQKKMKAEELPQAGWKALWRSLILNTMLRLPFRYKIPPRVAEPLGDTSLQEMQVRWEQSRGELQRFMAHLPREMQDRALFRHPLAGHLSFAQTLRFMNNHFQHHLDQIDRIQKDERFPAHDRIHAAEMPRA